MSDDPLLEQVAEPRDPVGEQLEGVVLLDVLREHDDADGRVLGPDLLGRVDPLGRVGRRHPDVGEDGVRAVDSATDCEQRLRVGHAVDELDGVDLGEQAGDALPYQEVVVREDDAEHHARERRPCERTGRAGPARRAAARQGAGRDTAVVRQAPQTRVRDPRPARSLDPHASGSSPSCEPPSMSIVGRRRSSQAGSHQAR